MTDVPAANRTVPTTDNLPPTDAIAEKLASNYAEMLERSKELLDSWWRAPKKIEDEETAGKMATLSKQLLQQYKALDKARSTEKEPYLEGGRCIDAFFKSRKDEIDASRKGIARVQVAWEDHKAELERQRLEAERKAQEEAARKAQEEADRLAKEAEAAMVSPSMSDDPNTALERWADADDAAQTAAEAVKQAEAAVQHVHTGPTRSEHGAVTSRVVTIKHEIVNLPLVDLNALRNWITPDMIDKAVRAYIRAGGETLKERVKQGEQPIRGIRLYERSSVTTR